jgi:hypothetical protein
VTIDSAAEFVRLRESEDPAEYWRAAHEDASIDVWRDVISDYPDMRFWVAQNKTVPVEILTVLAQDADGRVRSMVARKRSIGDEIMKVLAADVDSGVRMSIARHPKVTRSVLELLINDEWDEVARVAQERLDDGLR